MRTTQTHLLITWDYDMEEIIIKVLGECCVINIGQKVYTKTAKQITEELKKLGVIYEKDIICCPGDTI